MKADTTTSKAFAVLATVLLVISACSGDRHDRQAEMSASSDVDPARNALYGPYDAIPGQLIPATRNAPDALLTSAPPLGSCVQVLGKSPTAEITVLPCDDERATLKVFQVAVWPAACAADFDQKYFRGLPDGRSAWTACLDINWRPGKCIEVQDEHARTCRPERDADQRTLQRVVAGKASDTVCSAGYEALVHAVRNYTVCTSRRAS
jgi:hypothetical protein